MAIAAPATVVAEYGQDLTVTVTLVTPTSVAGWTATATLRAYHGSTALATKTIGSGITVTDAANGIFVVAFSAADLTLTPGAYVWEMDRSNVGFLFPIVDPSAFIIRPSAGAAFPTLTNLSEYADAALGGVTPTDAQVRQYLQLLAAAEEWVRRYCNREFVYRAAATEYYSGTGTYDLFLARWPVVPSAVAVYEDWNGNFGQTAGSFDATTTALTVGVDFAVPITPTWGDGLNHTGIVKRLGTRWPYRNVRPVGLLGYAVGPLEGSIKVVYTAGYQLIPYPVKSAVWTLATVLAESAESGRLISSESGEGHAVAYAAVEDTPWTVRHQLAPYRRLLA